MEVGTLGFLPGALCGLVETGAVVPGPGGTREVGRVGSSLPKLSSSEQVLIQKAKKYAMEHSIKLVLMKQTVQHQQQQAKSLQRQQAMILMCRIYVGSINFEVREETLRTAFGPYGPIKAICMSWDPVLQKHKGFAFVDFETPEAAELALQHMNGSLVSGRNIKVGRPSNIPQAQSIIEDIEREARDYHRIYVGGIHKDLGKEDIRSVFEAFGPIKSCDLVPTVVEGRHRGYGFIEYDNIQSCLDAIAAMNQFDLGGQLLLVGRAITPPELKNNGAGMDAKISAIPTASAVAAAAVTAKMQALDAVAENMGVNAHDISQGEHKKKEREREKERERRERDRDRRRDKDRGRDRRREADRDGDKSKGERSSEQTPAVEHNSSTVSVLPVLPVLPNQPPSHISSDTPAHAINQSRNPMDRNEATQAAIEQAQQIELQKKLLDDGEYTTLSQQENMQIKGQSARHLVMQKLMGAHGGLRESKVVCLRNMVGHAEVDEALQEEIEEECSKYGEVDNVIIYQERQSEDEDAEILVKIFVEYNSPNGAKKARDSLNGRFFGGRHVRADVYDQVLYEEQDFSH